MLLCRIADTSLRAQRTARKSATHLVPVAIVLDLAVVNIKIGFLARCMPCQSYPDLYDMPCAARRAAVRASRHASYPHPECRTGVELADEDFECGDVALRAGAGRGRARRT